MNFVFINPPRKIASNNIWHVINSEHPPLGLALLSSIWDAQGHTSQIIDAAALRLSVPEILDRIKPAMNYVGLTATTPEISSAISIANGIREKFPDIQIVMGGVHPTVFHEDLVRDKICDIVVRNEGESFVIELARGTPLHLIPNLTWHNEQGDTIINPDAETYVELDSLPFPAYEKLPMHLYHSTPGAARGQPSIGMVTSRGCPGHCTFCFSGMFGSSIRFMSPARVIEHIELLQKKYGIREISFYDDTFTANKKNVAELCQLIIEKGIKLSWSCFARVDTVTPELLLLMNKAGCHQIMYGFETPNANILKNIDKRIAPEQFQNAISWTRSAKINIRGAFMLGNPGETQGDLQKTIDYAKNADIQLAVFNITTPYPGTAMYNEFRQKDSLLHQNWDLYNLGEPVLKLDTVSDEVVKQYYYKSYRDFYLRPAFILRYILSIRTLSEFSTYVKATLAIAFMLCKDIFLKRKNRIISTSNIAKYYLVR